MTPAEAARRMGVSRQRVHSMMRSGVIKYTRLKASKRGYSRADISESEINRWLNRQTEVPGGQMNSKDVADRFGVRLSTVSRWVSQGLLPAEKLDNNILVFKPKDVKSFKRPVTGRQPKETE